MRTKFSIYERTKKGQTHEDLEIIDFHSHIGPWYNFYCPDSSASAMVHALDLVGMKKVCINPNAGISSDPRLGNLITLNAMEKYPDRVIGFVCVNPRYPDEMIAELKLYCGEKGMKGIKIHPTYHDIPINDPVYIPVWEYAQQHQLPVISHTWDDPRCHPRLFEPLAEKYPEISFVLGHSGMPDFKGAVETAKKYNNIYLELTAAVIFHGLVGWLVERVGADKVIYGSDMGGWFSPLHAIGPVLYSKISDEDKKKILSENARRLLKL